MKIIKASAVLTCNPALAGAAVGLLASGVSAYSSYQSGQSQKKAAEYNAEMQERQAKDAIAIGAQDAAARRDRARKVASAQAEAAAMSGVDVNTGTPLALLTETAGLGELDALTAQNNAQRQAWGYQGQAILDAYQGRMAGQAGTLNATSTFLGGLSSAASYGKAGSQPKTGTI